VHTTHTFVLRTATAIFALTASLGWGACWVSLTAPLPKACGTAPPVNGCPVIPTDDQECDSSQPSTGGAKQTAPYNAVCKYDEQAPTGGTGLCAPNGKSGSWTRSCSRPSGDGCPANP